MAVALGRGDRRGGGLGLGRRGRQLGRRRRPGELAVPDHGEAADRVVLEIDEDVAVLGLAQFLGQAQQVVRVQRGRLLGQAAEQVGVADDGHAVAHHRLAGHGQFAVAALLGREVDDHAARLHALHHLGGDQLGRGLARDQRGGDDDVDFPRLLRVHRALRGLEALAHHLGVAAAARALFLVIDLDELATERDHLVGDFGAGVVGAHDGAQVGRGADGGEAGHAGAGDEDLGRRDLAGGGDLAVEEAAEGVGGFDHRPIAADAGHRGQRVHLLRTAQLARQTVDGEHGGAPGLQRLHQLGVLRRPHEADQRRAFAQHGDFFQRRRAHLEYDVGPCPDVGGAR